MRESTGKEKSWTNWFEIPPMGIDTEHGYMAVFIDSEVNRMVLHSDN